MNCLSCAAGVPNRVGVPNANASAHARSPISGLLGDDAVVRHPERAEASGHIRRTPDPVDKRATVVALTDSGKALAEQIRRLWLTLAQETTSGLPAETLEHLPGILHTMSTNVSGKPPA
jgi:hypothetical protein